MTDRVKYTLKHIPTSYYLPHQYLRDFNLVNSYREVIDAENAFHAWNRDFIQSIADKLSDVEIVEVIDDFNPRLYVEGGFVAHPFYRVYLHPQTCECRGKKGTLAVFAGAKVNVRIHNGRYGGQQRDLMNLYADTFSRGFTGRVAITGGSPAVKAYNFENGVCVAVLTTI